jgi:hypothetical protein
MLLCPASAMGKMSGETDAAPSNPRMVSSLFIWLLHISSGYRLLGDHMRQHLEFLIEHGGGLVNRGVVKRLQK